MPNLPAFRFRRPKPAPPLVLEISQADYDELMVVLHWTRRQNHLVATSSQRLIVNLEAAAKAAREGQG